VREPVADAEQADEGVAPRPVGTAPRQPSGQLDVLGCGQLGQQVEGLEHEPDPVATQRGQLGVAARAQFGVAEEDLAGRGVVQPGEQVQQRGLAGTGRPHDRGEPGRGYGEIHPVERADGGIAAAVDLHEVDGTDGRTEVARRRPRVGTGRQRAGHRRTPGVPNRSRSGRAAINARTSRPVAHAAVPNTAAIMSVMTGTISVQLQCTPRPEDRTERPDLVLPAEGARAEAQ
jgi:hypothetical protein